VPSPLAFEIPAFFLGLLLGSFLNVCISRLPSHKSLSKPRSHCPHCKQTIRWHDNVPLLSWIILRARCRHCNQPISWRYPAVELAVGLWFALAVTYFTAVTYRASLNSFDATRLIESLGIAILGFLLIGLIVMDWQTHHLPDAFTLTGILLGFVLICVQAVFLAPGQLDIHFDPQRNLRLSSPGSFVAKGDLFMTGPEHLVLGRLLAIVTAGSILLIVRLVYRKLRRRDGLGLGDAKLVAMIAAFLGFWPAILALFLGFILCSIYALTLMARGRATTRTRLPLGTFLSIGGLIAALLGGPLIAWYTSLL
jgi:leader peptidase (prepilin peptidase)/N-methyltransferase